MARLGVAIAGATAVVGTTAVAEHEALVPSGPEAASGDLAEELGGAGGRDTVPEALSWARVSSGTKARRSCGTCGENVRQV